MRSISIMVNCDACEAEIEEEVEGGSSVTLIVRGEKREMDICDDCLGGTFLQEARPVTNRQKRKTEKPFACDGCDKSFGTQRGLFRHQTMTHK